MAKLISTTTTITEIHHRTDSVHLFSARKMGETFADLGQRELILHRGEYHVNDGVVAGKREDVRIVRRNQDCPEFPISLTDLASQLGTTPSAITFEQLISLLGDYWANEDEVNEANQANQEII